MRILFQMLQLCTYGKGHTPHSSGGMTLAEYRAHYSVWAVLASPLILSADLRTIKEEHPDCLELMLNEEIVAVNQVHVMLTYSIARKEFSALAQPHAAPGTNPYDHIVVASHYFEHTYA